MNKVTLNSQIKQVIQTNDFVVEKSLAIEQLTIKFFYYKNISNVMDFNNYYFYKINPTNYHELSKVFPGIFNPLTDITIENLIFILSKGYIILSINDEYYYLIELSKLNDIEQQPSHIDPTNLFESRSDFSDSVNDNIALITKRLKTNDLVIKHFLIGNKSKADCYVLCMKDFMKENYVQETIKKIELANEEYYLSINDLMKLFDQGGLIPLAFSTSSPNTICSNLIKGRVVILLDNTPVACVVPATLSTFTSLKNEINTPKYYTIFNKLFICFFIFLSIFSLGAFVSIMNFHTSIFSPILIANIQLTERGTSFPIFFEILIILFLYEFYRYASSRSPQNYIQNIVIFFGGLVIGQNAVESGTTGSLILMLTSISYLSSFAITTNPYLITSLNIFRLFLLLFSYSLGFIGFIFASLVFILYLISQKSAGVSFLDPFIPVNFKNIIHFFIPTKKEDAIDI